jgi:hypothetical protein
MGRELLKVKWEFMEIQLSSNLENVARVMPD